MQVEHTLAPMFTLVDYHSVAVLGNPLLLSNDCHYFHKVTEQCYVAFLSFAYSCQSIPVLWDHQEVNRSHRIYVSKSKAEFILIDDFSWYFLANDSVENSDFFCLGGLCLLLFVRHY